MVLGVSLAVSGLAACGRDDAAASPYCRRIAEINGLDLLADPTPAAVQDDLEQLLALTRRAARVAPDEIADDLREAVTAQVRFNELYAKHGWDPTLAQQDPDFVALASDPHLAEVYTRLEHYEVRECPGDPSPRPSVAPA